MASNSLEAISRQLQHITALCQRPEPELLNRKAGMSAWSAAEHIDHTLKVAASILRQMMHPENVPSRKFSWIGRIILLTGYIPRGKGKSPEALRGDQATLMQIREHTADLERLLSAARGASPPPPAALLVRHPIFGGMNWDQALRFTVVHTRHHLKILNQILS